MKASVLTIAIMLPLLAATLRAQDSERLYLARHMYHHDCSSCHGDKGQGNDELRVPAIGGLPDDYTMRQMANFRELLRADDPEDLKALTMHEDAKALDDDTLLALAQIVSEMDPPKSLGSAIGDRDAGKVKYEKHCASCHGHMAQGNVAKEAPPLHGFQDWYIVDQIQKFKKGKRKADPTNIDSVKMHGMAKNLWRAKDVRDVASFIVTSLEGYEDAEP